MDAAVRASFYLSGLLWIALGVCKDRQFFVSVAAEIGIRGRCHDRLQRAGADQEGRDASVRAIRASRIMKRISRVAWKPVDLAGKTIAAALVVGIISARIPIPVRKSERRIANQGTENHLVEIKVSAVPRQKPPATMNFHSVEAVESAAAVPTMNVALIIPSARIVAALLRKLAQL